MKKKVLVFALALMGAGALPCVAANEEGKDLGLSFEVGADVVSSYIWRGQNLGGLSIQPSVTLAWKGLFVSGWGNIGADNWKFQDINPEMDWTVGFDRWGINVDVTHYYYFGGEKFLLRGDYDMTLEENASLSTLEAHAGFHLGDIVEKVPLSIDWYTTVLGGDSYKDENNQLKRAYSTYVEVGYDFVLPLGTVIGARVGLTPWLGAYSGYQEVWTNAGTVAITNVNLRVEHAFEFKHLSLSVFAEGMLNCYGLDKNNIITKITDRSEQRLNGCIGGSIYIGGEW